MWRTVEANAFFSLQVLWGSFSGPIQNRELVEADILVNLRFAWGNGTVDPDVYDLMNILVHEVGHAIGFGHTFASGATMNPTAAKGETSKRTIADCEVEGLCSLYEEPACTAGDDESGRVPRPFVDTQCGVSGNEPPSPSNAAEATRAGALWLVAMLLCVQAMQQI